MQGSTIVCVGGAHIDRTAQMREAVRLGASNPVCMRAQVGGVACNVSRTLARLDNRTALIALVGRDAEGDAVEDAAAAAGVDTAGLVRTETPTGSYIVVLDAAGELVIGLAGLAINDEATPTRLSPHCALLDHAAAVCVDANLPPETLVHLADCVPAGRPLFAAAVSPAKAPRLLPLLPRLSGLFANRGEAAVLAGEDGALSSDPLDVAERLRRAGPEAVFVTLGPDGAVAATAGFGDRRAPPAPNPLRDVNGAGDGFMAGAIDALLRGRTCEEALRLGLAVASLTCESDEAASAAVSPAAVAARAAVTQSKEPFSR